MESWLSLARQHTVSSLPKALRGRRVVEKRAVVFRLSIGGRAELNEALLAFGAKATQRGLVDKEKALIRILRTAMEVEGYKA